MVCDVASAHVFFGRFPSASKSISSRKKKKKKDLSPALSHLPKVEVIEKGILNFPTEKGKRDYYFEFGSLVSTCMAVNDLYDCNGCWKWDWGIQYFCYLFLLRFLCIILCLFFQVLVQDITALIGSCYLMQVYTLERKHMVFHPATLQEKANWFLRLSEFFHPVTTCLKKLLFFMQIFHSVWRKSFDRVWCDVVYVYWNELFWSGSCGVGFYVISKCALSLSGG